MSLLIPIFVGGGVVKKRESPDFRSPEVGISASLIMFVFVTSFEATPLFRGKGHFFKVPTPRFNLHSGDTLALKK